jgi:hypothetical protein
MIDSDVKPDKTDNKHKHTNTQAESKPGQAKSKMSKSMHDGVEVWCDCCSCEAEPYWVEAMKAYDEQSSRNKDAS